MLRAASVFVTTTLAWAAVACDATEAQSEHLAEADAAGSDATEAGPRPSDAAAPRPPDAAGRDASRPFEPNPVDAGREVHALAEGGSLGPSATTEADAERPPAPDSPPSALPDGGTEADPEQAVRDLLGITERMQLPFIPEENPLTAEKIELGRHLFYDERLSANETQSCASCHQQALAFSDGRERAVGSTGQTLTRNSQGLANVAYFSTLTWASDSLLHLERQLLVPITNDNPVELGVTDGVVEEVMARFDGEPLYVELFESAFPQSDSGATVNKIAFALASFCRSMISVSSRFDRYRAGDDSALTEQERLGLGLFNGERFECFHCHSGILLSSAYRDINTPDGSVRMPFFNNGLYNVDGEGGYPSHDQGLYDLTFNPDHRGLFRPASLRNVGLTAPYMHDGSIATLREVVEHYAAGGRLIEDGAFAGDGRLSPLKSGLVRGFEATDEEIDAVVAFLEALTDDDFITDPRFANPFE